MARIESIVLQPKDHQYPEGRFDYFLRVPAETARLVDGHGLEGDDKAGRNPRRQVNLLSREWLAAMEINVGDPLQVADMPSLS